MTVSRTPFGGGSLRTARKELGLTQAELAAYLGTDQRVISLWESGKLEIERPETLALALDGLRLMLAPKGMSLEIEAELIVDGASDLDWTVRQSSRHCDQCDAPESHLEKTRNVVSYQRLCLNCASRGGILTLRRPLSALPRT